MTLCTVVYKNSFYTFWQCDSMGRSPLNSESCWHLSAMVHTAENKVSLRQMPDSGGLEWYNQQHLPLHRIVLHSPVLFFSRPQSKGWPHHGRTSSVDHCPVSLFPRESCPRLDVVHPGRTWSSSPACTWHCYLHYLFVQATP